VERPSLELIELEDPELQDFSRVRSGILGLVKWLVVVVELSLRSDTLLPQESSPYIVAGLLRWSPGSVPVEQQRGQQQYVLSTFG